MISNNHFSKNQPTKGSGTFTDQISRSSHSFAHSAPTKGSGSFADIISRSTHKFSNLVPSLSDKLFTGENTGGTAYGEDFTTFGDIYGQNQYGGLTHFLGRIENTPTH